MSSLGLEKTLKALVFPDDPIDAVSEQALRTAFEYIKFETTGEGCFDISFLFNEADTVVVNMDNEGHPYGVWWLAGDPQNWQGWGGKDGGE